MTDNTQPATPPIPKYHVEASGHPTKPDISGAFPEMPDLDGYKRVFWREIEQPAQSSMQDEQYKGQT